MKKKNRFLNVENAILSGCLIMLLLIMLATVFDIFAVWNMRILALFVCILITLFIGHTIFSLKRKHEESENEWYALKKQHLENTMEEIHRKEISALKEEYDRIHNKQIEIYKQLKEYVDEQRFDEITDFLQEMIPEIQEGDIFLSGNEVIDVVLSRKIIQAYNVGIHLQCDVQKIECKDVTDADMNVLLSNLLDNAIEAVVLYMHSLNDNVNISDNIISFRIKRYKQYLLICENNPCIAAAYDEKNRLKTRKKDSYMHGIGMLSMQRIVEKYNGVMDYSIQDDHFSIKIILEDVMDE